MSTIRKIFQFRDICQTLIRHEVGNGASTFLRLDKWHPLGPLYKRYGENVCSNIGRSLQAKASTQLLKMGTGFGQDNETGIFKKSLLTHLKLFFLIFLLRIVLCGFLLVLVNTQWNLLGKQFECRMVSWTGVAFFGFPKMFLDAHSFYGWPCKVNLRQRIDCWNGVWWAMPLVFCVEMGLMNFIIIYFSIVHILELSGRRYCEGT